MILTLITMLHPILPALLLVGVTLPSSGTLQAPTVALQVSVAPSSNKGSK